MLKKLSQYLHNFTYDIFNNFKKDKYCDPSKLPRDILTTVLNQFLRPEDICKMCLVSRSWKQAFGSEEFLKGSLKNHTFINRNSQDDDLKAFEIDISTRKNILNNIYVVNDIALGNHAFEHIKLIKTFKNGLVAQVGKNLFHIDTYSNFQKIEFHKQAHLFTVLNNNIMVLTEDCEIYAINIDVYSSRREIYSFNINGSTSIFFQTSEEIRYNGPFDYFEVLANGFILAAKEHMYYVDHVGSVLKSITLCSRIMSLSIINETIIIGDTDGGIHRYDKNLKKYGSIYYPRVNQAFSLFQMDNCIYGLRFGSLCKWSKNSLPVELEKDLFDVNGMIVFKGIIVVHGFQNRTKSFIKFLDFNQKSIINFNTKSILD
ncbi:MAG: F-box protein [Parachlamydiales bacterium]|nr:F-box protein [Parachlamydiales bacterium]